MVKPGCLLVYAVCSLQPEEGPQRIHALVTSDDRVERLPLTPDELPGLTEALTPDGDLRSLPCHLAAAGGLVGFYACRLRRRASRPCRLRRRPRSRTDERRLGKEGVRTSKSWWAPYPSKT